MKIHVGKACVVVVLAAFCHGCGHTRVSQVALLSYGDLEGRTLPATVSGPVLKGGDFSPPVLTFCFLSKAVQDALKGTEYDTLINAEVTTHTGLFVWSNGITVQGTGFNSKTLPKIGDVK